MSMPSSLRLKTQQPEEEQPQRPKSLRLKQKEESLPENINRQIGRSEARIFETALGAPRAFGEFLESIVPEKLITKGAEKIGLEKPVKKGFELSKKYAPYKILPKSEDVREIFKTISGGKTEPRSEIEAKSDEVISDFAALTLPFPGQKLKFLKPSLLALGGNVAKDVVGNLGGSEKEKTWAKLGTITIGALINPKAAENLKNDLYKEARSLLPDNAYVDAFKLQQGVKNYRTNLLKGGSAPYKNAALTKLDEIENAAKSGDIPIEELEKFKISINTLRSGLYEEFKGNKPGRKLAKASLDHVSKLIDNAIDIYQHVNPEWHKAYRTANEVHGAIAQSYKARNFIVKHAKHLGVPTLLTELGLYHAGGIPLAAETTILGGTALMGGEIAAKIYNSKTLSKHYMNLVNAALKEDIVAVRENLKRMDEELKKDQSLKTPTK